VQLLGLWPYRRTISSDLSLVVATMSVSATPASFADTTMPTRLECSEYVLQAAGPSRDRRQRAAL